MNVPPPAATAAPLALYDYTHGQRRLTIWRQSDASGFVIVHAAISVPVTLQEPGEAPVTAWVDVASAADSRPLLLPSQGASVDHFRLVLGAASFWLFRMEAEAIAEYLGLGDVDGENAG